MNLEYKSYKIDSKNPFSAIIFLEKIDVNAITVLDFFLKNRLQIGCNMLHPNFKPKVEI